MEILSPWADADYMTGGGKLLPFGCNLCLAAMLERKFFSDVS